MKITSTKDSGLNNLRGLTQNFCFRLNAIRRRIVILHNDLIAFKLGQKGKLSSASYSILSPKTNLFFMIATGICLGFVLQACNTSPANVKSDTNSDNIDKASILKLFYDGLSVDLHDLVQGYSLIINSDNKLVKKPLHVLHNSFPLKTILNSKRGNALKNCEFIALRVELDGKVITKEWLVTTKGAGKCNPQKKDSPRNFWVIQQNKKQQDKILHEGRAYHIQITGVADPKKVLWSGIYTDNSTHIKNTEVLCHEQYKMQGSRCKQIESNIQVYKSTGSMLNSHTPEMYWKTVTGDPDYQCPSK